MSLNALIVRQKAWAAHRPARGHVLESIEANLFRRLHPATHAEFAAGAGDELGMRGQTAGLRSLRSSSAFACNIFDPWRERDIRGLIAALELDTSLSKLAFEHKVPHGLGSIPPHLDVILLSDLSPTGPTGTRVPVPVGFEIKFAEPYGKVKQRPRLDAKYFPSNHARWSEVGLPQTQTAAEAIGRTEGFARLNAGQLVKHILGLATTFDKARPVRLRYLWFDVGGKEAEDHQEEISRFTVMVRPEVDFAAIRFQDLFARLVTVAEPEVGYLDYLRSRYIAA